jgi:hypothetical protein
MKTLYAKTLKKATGRRKRPLLPAARAPQPSLGGRCRPQAAKEGQAKKAAGTPYLPHGEGASAEAEEAEAEGLQRSCSFDKTGVTPSGGTTFLLVQKDGEERTRQREGLFTSALPSGLSSSEICDSCAPYAPTLGPSLCSGLAVGLQKEMSRPDDRALKWGSPNLPSGEGAACRRRKRDKL